LIEDEDWAASLRLPRSQSQLRIKAHEEFDPIWRSGLLGRGEAYRVLATELGVPEPEAHFRRMGVEQLEAAIPAVRRLRARLESQSRPPMSGS
jgi:hypothetical protein